MEKILMGLLLKFKIIGLHHLEAEIEQEKMDLERAEQVIDLKID